MKIIITESLRSNLTDLIPIESKSGQELMRGFFNDSTNAESAFSRQCRAAKFIFDDVVVFSPRNTVRQSDDANLIRELIKISTVNEDDSLISVDAWKASAQIAFGLDDRLGEIDSVLTTCLPCYEKADDCVILSQDSFITAHQIRCCKKLSREAMLYLLATAGVDISLPSLIAKSNDDIESIKNAFQEERIDYLLYLNKSLDEMLAASADSSLDIDSIYEFAKKKFALELRLKSRKIAAIADKKGNKVLNSVFTEFLDQAPTIGAAAIKFDFIGVGQALFKSLLSAINGERDTQKAIAEYKEAAYLYRILT